MLKPPLTREGALAWITRQFHQKVSSFEPLPVVLAVGIETGGDIHT